MQILLYINGKYWQTVNVNQTTTVREFKEIVRHAFGGTRTNCSFDCRYYGVNPWRGWDKWDEEAFCCDVFGNLTNLPTMLHFSHRFGSCQRCCRSLIRVNGLDCQMEAFTRKERLGFGSSGEVYAVTHNATNRKLALKIVRCRSAEDQQHVLDKYAILTKLDNDCVVPFLDAFKVGQDVGVLMPKYRGTLFDEIKTGQGVSAKKVLEIAHSILEGLVFIASKNLVHRDIKPSNIFLAPSHQEGVDYHLLGDMDAAKMLDWEQTHVTGGTGTFAHLAPEQVSDFTSTTSTDVWGIGCVLYWLMLGGMPNNPSCPPKVMHLSAIREGESYASNLRSELEATVIGANHLDLVDLVVRMLSFKTDERPDPTECLKLVQESVTRHGYNIHVCKCGLPSRGDFATEEPLHNY